MIAAFGTMIALAIALFFSIEGFGGNTTLNVLMMIVGVGAFLAAGASMLSAWRARPRG